MVYAATSPDISGPAALRQMGPFANELPITYHFVWLKGQETRPNVRAFRNWFFSEMGHTVAQWAALTIAPG
jgi:DNA-binding transcriptional LysR family regulator